MDPVQRAQLMIAAHRYDDACAELERLVASDPDHHQGLCLLAQAHLGARRPERALVAGDAAVRSAPDDTWGQRLRALALHGLDRDAEALPVGRWMVAAEPDSWRSWWLLSVVSRRVSGAQDESLHAGGRAVSLAPDIADTHAAYGSALLQTGRLDAAETAFRRALAIDPEDAFSHNGLGQLALRRGRTADAAVGFRDALLTQPQEQAARHNLEVALQVAARPYVITVWICAVVVSYVVPEGSHDQLARVAGAVAALVAAGVLAATVGRFAVGLPAGLRRHYARFVRSELRLWAGALLLLAPVALLLAVAAVPHAVFGLAVAAAGCALVGRVLFLRGARWSLFGLRRRR